MRAGMLWPPAPPSPCLVFLALFLAACAPQTEARGFTLRARVPDEPLSLAEAVARGRAVRPVVVEATPDEQTLSPAFERLSGVDDDQRAFGRKVTMAEVLALVNQDSGKAYVNECLSHLFTLIRAGYFRLVDEYSMSSLVAQRLRRRQARLNVTAADADLVLIGAGCTRSWYTFREAEEAALQHSLRPSPALRVTAVGTTFQFLRDLKWKHEGRLAEKCFEPQGVLSIAHVGSDPGSRWVNTGFPTDIIVDGRGTKPLEPIFAEHHGRDILLSFRGSISRNKNGGPSPLKPSRLETHRYHNVRNLTVAAAQFALDNASWVRHVFWTPGVRGLDDLEISATPSAAESTEKDNSPVNATAFVREMPASQRLAASTFTLLTYMRSHFCFQPPGDDFFRKGIYDSLQAGCVPVLLPTQREPVTYLLGGVLRRCGLQSLDDVFYFLPEDQIEDGAQVLAALLALAENPAAMAQRRANLLKVARYTYFSSEDTEDGDALTISLGLLLAGENN